MESMHSTSRLARWVPFYYGWVVVGAVGLTMGLSTVVTGVVFSIFIEPWSDEFGWSRTAIVGAFSFATVLAAVAGPVVGRATDRHGGRVILGGGALLIGGALISLAFVTTLALFYMAFAVGRVAMMNMQNLASPTVVANWFVRRRAFVMAVMLSGNTVGMGLWPLLAGIVLAAHGWRVAILVLGGIVSVLAVVPLVLIVARRPEHIGLQPDGSPAVTDELSGESEPFIEQQWTARQAVRTRAFWLLMAAQAAAVIVGAGVGVHRVPFFVGRGLADGWIGPMLLVSAIGMAIGGFVAAWSSKYMPNRRVIWASMMGTGITMLLILRVPADGTVLLFALVEGAFTGGIFAMLPVIYADYYGRGSIGTIRGWTHPVVMVALAAGPLYGAVIFDALDSYTWVFVSFAAVVIGGSAAAWFAVPPESPIDTRVR
jgi:MFS family permease